MRVLGRALLLVATALVGCAFDDNPSLGRFESELGGEVPAPPEMDAGATPVVDADADADADVDADVDAGRFDHRDPRARDGGAPDAGDACFAGRYRAELYCMLVDARLFPFDPSRPAPGSMDTTAPSTMDFRLEAMPGDREARIVEADFTFSSWGLVFMGRLDGRLDCTTGRFDARIEDGLAGQPFSPTTIPFVGELHGDVDDPVAGTLAGTWWHGPADGMTGCTGDWTAYPIP